MLSKTARDTHSWATSHFLKQRLGWAGGVGGLQA